VGLLQPGDDAPTSDSVALVPRACSPRECSVASACRPPSACDPSLDAQGLPALIRPETRVIYLESPGSYTFEIQDVPAICAMARERGALDDDRQRLGVTCFLARPFDWGVDVSLLPLTKYRSGHSDAADGCRGGAQRAPAAALQGQPGGLGIWRGWR
jgi:cystathionine beta-lyase